MADRESELQLHSRRLTEEERAKGHRQCIIDLFAAYAQFLTVGEAIDGITNYAVASIDAAVNADRKRIRAMVYDLIAEADDTNQNGWWNRLCELGFYIDNPDVNAGTKSDGELQSIAKAVAAEGVE